ncbi:MAG: hypothetical protein OEV21_06295, partial [Thermoplasmata archaeon]|nr:hypothetical protein [Thermoplasmata archaeon]
MKQKIVVSVAIAVIMLLSPILSLSAAANQDHTSSKDRLVVSFDSADAIVKLEELAESHGSTIRYLEKTGLALWENWNSMIKTYIEKIPGVEAVEIERSVRTAFTPSDPYFSTSQWGLERINADTAWDFTLGSSSVVIAVL